MVNILNNYLFNSEGYDVYQSFSNIIEAEHYSYWTVQHLKAVSLGPGQAVQVVRALP